MHAGLLGEERRALERLDDQVVRDVTREAEVDGGIDERLHHQEDVRRPGARRRRSPSPRTSRRPPRAGRRARRAVRRPGPAAPRSSPGSRTRRSCPCRAGPGCSACCGPPGRARAVRSGLRWSHRRGHSGRAGRAGGVGPISRPTRPSIWGLIPNRMTSAASTASTLLGHGPDAVVAGQRVAPLRPRMAGDDLVRADQLAAEQAGDHGLRHDAGADRGDRALLQR